jgi:hypothetical protein
MGLSYHRPPEAQRAYDARRLKQQSAKGNLWSRAHPGYDAERMRRTRAERGRAPALLDDAFKPLRVKSDCVMVTCDWHVPFLDYELADQLLEDARQMGIHDLIVGGDFWDCDNYSIFVPLKEAGMSFKQTFQGEVEEVQDVLMVLTHAFDNIWFCRGNHEFRWMAQNGGKMGMKELFFTTGITEGYEVTQDDHLILDHCGQDWLICHPRSYRQAPLSVGRDLAAKHQMNVVVAHGHGFAQGQDRSGHFQVLDGGGLFDARQLEYMRQTSTHPAVQSGYYIFDEGEIIPKKGRASL